LPLILSALYIYPVKGLKGISVEASRCTGRGLERDRRWMVVDADGEFISQRTVPKMATVWTDIDGDTLTLSAPDVDSVSLPVAPAADADTRVTVWSSTLEAAAPAPEADAWLSRYLGMPCRLVYMPPGARRNSNPRYAGPDKAVSFADGYAYLVCTEASLAELNARLAAKSHGALPMNRFRPNLVIAGGRPFAEDALADFRIGALRFRAVKPCDRCVVTTTDQATAERDHEPLRTLATYRKWDGKVFFGQNVVHQGTGRLSVGAPLVV
jgi:uncharacterized protein YcbX